MSDTIDIAESEPVKIRSKHFLVWLQVGVALVAVTTSIGTLFVYKDRQDAMSAVISQIQADRKDRIANYDAFRGEQIANWATAVSFMNQQLDFNRNVSLHMSDKGIHVTDEQMRNLIAAQLQPLALNMENAKATLAAQEKQLTRIEDSVKEIANQARRNQEKNETSAASR
jgi:hypothetical protein